MEVKFGPLLPVSNNRRWRPTQYNLLPSPIAHSITPALMAHEPKLEIYKLQLKNKKEAGYVRLSELLRSKFNGYPEQDYPNLTRPIPPDEILNLLYSDLVNKIDQAGFNKNESKKKGFTVSSTLTEGELRANIKSYSSQSIVCGTLEGGNYGRTRTLKEVDDKKRGASIEPKHIVGDQFYFLLYTPLNEGTIIAMIQGYTEIRIADVFLKFLESYFKSQGIYKCDVQPYIPQELRDRYLKSATFKSLSFTSDWNIKANFDEEIVKREYNLEVKITITDKSESRAKHKSFKKFLEKFGRSSFKLVDQDERNLGDFGIKRAKMESAKKEFNINFDDEDDIRPTILLIQEGIPVNEGLVPDFDAVDTYCKALLEQIKEDLNPRHAVERL
jgi:hypothetical protein